MYKRSMAYVHLLTAFKLRHQLARRVCFRRLTDLTRAGNLKCKHTTGKQNLAKSRQSNHKRPSSSRVRGQIVRTIRLPRR